MDAQNNKLIGYFMSNNTCPFTLNEFFDRFEIEILPKKNPKYVDKEKPYIAFWRERLGHRIACTITDQEIEEHANSLYKMTTRHGHPYSPETRRKYVQTLNHLFNVACIQWRWLSDNPASRVDLHIQAIKQSQDNYNEKVSFSVKEFKEKFLKCVGAALKATKGEDFPDKPSVALSKLSGISKTSLQQLYDPDANVTLEKVLQLADAVGLRLVIIPKLGSGIMRD